MATSIKRTELPDAVYIKKHKGKGRKIVVHFIKKLKGKPVFKDKPETIIKKVLFAIPGQSHTNSAPQIPEKEN